PGREEAGGPGERASGLLLSEESPGNRRAARSPRANRDVAAGHRVVAWGPERTTTSARPAHHRHQPPTAPRPRPAGSGSAAGVTHRAAGERGGQGGRDR